MPYIANVTPNLFNGLFTEKINFMPELNLISGENGTGKTKLLALIKKKENIEVINDSQQNIRIQAFSPKRNSEQKTLENLLRELKSSDKNINAYLQKLGSQDLTDLTFTSYPSVAEIYYYVYNNLCKSGGDQRQYMRKTTLQLNKVFKMIFPHIKFYTSWNIDAGVPNLLISKNGKRIAINTLSCGEREVLSLVLNLYISKDDFDVFLIDEPEVHLNWHLEEKLFQFLRHFSHDFKKQLIVSTHSRAVFRYEFLPSTQFFYWERGKLQTTEAVSDNIRQKLAGDAIEIIRPSNLAKVVIFVEDRMHRIVVEEIIEQKVSNIIVSALGNASKVNSMYELSKSQGGWTNCYFMIDGDNQGHRYAAEPDFIHLGKYCIENYLIDTDICAEIKGKSKEEVEDILLEVIKQKKRALAGSSKCFEHLLGQINKESFDKTLINFLDVSEIFQEYIKRIGFKKDEEYIKSYVQYCIEKNILDNVFPDKLIKVIDNEI